MAHCRGDIPAVTRAMVRNINSSIYGNCLLCYHTAKSSQCCFLAGGFWEHSDSVTPDKILLFAQCDNLPNCPADVMVSIPFKQTCSIFSKIFHLQHRDIKFKLRLNQLRVQQASQRTSRVNDNIINMLYIKFEHQSPAINLTRFINRKNSSSTETSQAPDQEKGLSSGPKMHYWVKRIDEKKIQL